MAPAPARPWEGRQPTRGSHVFAALDGDAVVLRGDEAHHLGVVLRLAAGAPVSVADGSGALFQARVRRVEPGAVYLAVLDRVEVAVPRPALTVVHALPKGRKLDEVVQRLTELGVERVVPVTSARSQVELRGERAERAVARWRAVALAASRQSRRARVLEVAEITTWASALADPGPGVVCWEEATVPLRSVLDLDAPALVLGIGPEGGLTAEEATAGGLPAASLGPTVLRTETAALVAVTAVLTLAGRIG